MDCILIFYQILLTRFCKEMYGDQAEEFVFSDDFPKTSERCHAKNAPTNFEHGSPEPFEKATNLATKVNIIKAPL